MSDGSAGSTGIPELMARARSFGVEMVEGHGAKSTEPAKVRVFDTGATRNLDASKHDYEAFLSPLAVRRFGEYMHANRVQADGTLRAGDNWMRGIPRDSYMKSLWRHVIDAWSLHRGYSADETMEQALCAIIFNAQGYLHELLKAKLSRSALSEALKSQPEQTPESAGAALLERSLNEQDEE